MMTHMESVTLIVKSKLKLPCQGQVYVIRVMHIYL